MAIDETIRFIPLQIAVLTLSDSRELAEDKSGAILCERIIKAGHLLAERKILKDDYQAICTQLEKWIKDEKIQIIITTGGTGITKRDMTPEAVRAVITKEITGFGELFRMVSYEKIGSSALQSRALAGSACGSLIFALPGSPGACKDAWDEILCNQLDSRHRPCNFAELLPRI